MQRRGLCRQHYLHRPRICCQPVFDFGAGRSITPVASEDEALEFGGEHESLKKTVARKGALALGRFSPSCGRISQTGERRVVAVTVTACDALHVKTKPDLPGFACGKGQSS